MCMARSLGSFAAPRGIHETPAHQACLAFTRRFIARYWPGRWRQRHRRIPSFSTPDDRRAVGLLHESCTGPHDSPPTGSAPGRWASAPAHHSDIKRIHKRQKSVRRIGLAGGGNGIAGSLPFPPLRSPSRRVVARIVTGPHDAHRQDLLREGGLPHPRTIAIKPIRTTAAASQERLPAVVPRGAASSDSLSVVLVTFAA